MNHFDETPRAFSDEEWAFFESINAQMENCHDEALLEQLQKRLSDGLTALSNQ